jgi:hypothetical protein
MACCYQQPSHLLWGGVDLWPQNPEHMTYINPQYVVRCSLKHVV